MHMELLITIIKDYKKVEEILLGFIEIEVTGSTVIEGKGRGCGRRAHSCEPTWSLSWFCGCSRHFDGHQCVAVVA